jgi:hypothetical protein
MNGRVRLETVEPPMLGKKVVCCCCLFLEAALYFIPVMFIYA